MKKILYFIIVLSIVVFLVIVNKNNTDNYKVGVVYLLDHPSIHQGLDGFKSEIIKIEDKYDTKLDIVYSNAYGEMKNVNSILTSFNYNKKDIVIALTTPCAQVAKKVVPDIPTVFVGITDPVKAGLVDTLKQGKGNMVGTTSTVPYDKILDLYIALYPQHKKIGIIYSQQEANSLIIIQQIKELIKQKNLNLEIIASSISNTSDIYKISTSLSRQVDSFMMINDSAVVSSISLVLKVANENNIPTFASDTDSVKKGALFTYGLNYKDEGVASARLLEDILFNNKAPSEMEIYINNKSYLHINKKLLSNKNLTSDIKDNALIVDSNKD